MVLLLTVIYIVFISLGLPDSVFGVAWPALHKELGIAESFASVFQIIVGLCTSAVSVVAGVLIRKFGTGRVTLASIFLTVIGLVGISFSPNIVFMIIFAVILGYGAGAIDTGLNNFVSLNYKARHMNWLHCFWGIGVSASPLIMSFFLRDGSSWRSGYRAVALIQTAILIIVIVSMPLWKKAEDVSGDGKSGKDGSGLGISGILKIKGAGVSIISLGLYFAMENLIATWGASWLIHIFSLSPSDASKCVSLYFGGIMAGRFISGFLSVKLSDNALIRLGVTVSSLGMIFLFLPLSSYAVFGLFLVGFGFGPVFPSFIHAVPERFGKEYSADIIGCHMFGAYSIGFSIQLLFGYAATATTFKITPFVLLTLSAILALGSEYTIRAVKARSSS